MKPPAVLGWAAGGFDGPVILEDTFSSGLFAEHLTKAMHVFVAVSTVSKGGVSHTDDGVFGLGQVCL